MIPAAFAYARADSVDEAVALLAEHGDDAKLLAGGHSLLPLMKLRLATPSVLVDVGRLARPLLRARRRRHRRHRRAHPSPRRRDATRSCASTCRSSRAAAGEVGDPQVRHRGTLGGSLAHGDPASDLPAVVLALARQHRRARERRRARDRGRRLLPRLPRDRARARRDHHRGAGAEDATARAGRSRSSTAAPRTGRSSAWPRSAAPTPASRSSTWAPRRVRADAVEAALRDGRVARRRRGARRRRHRATVRSQRHARVPPTPGARARGPRPRRRRRPPEEAVR